MIKVIFRLHQIFSQHHLSMIKEVIGDDCGILCDPDDFQSWLNALQLLDDPQERRRLGMSARKAILGEYSWDCRASRVLENLYNV